MKTSSKVWRYLLLFTIVFTFGWESASYYIIHKVPAGSQVNATEVSPVAALSSVMGAPKEDADLTTFWSVWKMLSDMYVNETALDHQKMVYGAIKGMVASLEDPYTVYMTPEETVDFNQNLNGQLEGIGAELTVRDQSLVVVSPLKDSPAEKAGLQPGDVVYKIDGAVTADMSLFDAITKIRGAKGTSVVLTIMRKNDKDPFDVSIVRDTVNVDSVTMEDKGDGIAYIAINQFNDSTKPEFETKVKELLLKQPKGLILDLRFNGGGYLDISIDILSEFLQGKVDAVGIKRRDASKNETIQVSGEPQLPDVPLVVLINNGSASASEIVAGALKDHQRAFLIGEQSFGKGSVQEVDSLPDGSSLRITIAKWFTPNGESIDHVGIKPDLEVKMTDEDYAKDRDPQLDAAIKYLKGLKS